MIGEAAHIHAAASGPGARRYLASMAPEERSDIDNAIWLCANHARLIDRDETTYTAEALREMKRQHELRCANELRDASATGTLGSDLIAIGPDVVCVGEILGSTEDEWCLSLQQFVEGDIHTLISFIESFRQTDDYDRYTLVNTLGDGRVLRSAPSWRREGTGYIVICPVFPAFPRIEASSLGRDFALSEKNDLSLHGNSIAIVSGVDALPQKIKTNLSIQKGESPFYKNYGSDLAQHYHFLRESIWFQKLVKMKVIRQAAIPYPDAILNKRYTPFQCVERVFGVEVAAEASPDGWLPIRVDLGVKGLGRWGCDVSICVREQVPHPSLDELLGGPLSGAAAVSQP